MKSLCNRTGVAVSVLVLLGGAAATAPGRSADQGKNSRLSGARAEEARVSELYRKLPLSFELNRGQVDARVKFLSRGSGITVFLTGTETVLALDSPSVPGARAASRDRRPLPEDRPPASASVVRMRLVGATPGPSLEGLEPLPGKSNYFSGRDPARWRTNIPTYAKVRARGVYPGVDLVYYGNERQLEYDFVVSGGADPSKIELAFEGAEGLSVDPGGDLVLRLPDGELRQHKPLVYQETTRGRRLLEGRYVLRADNRVAFQVANYDRSRPLVIDPTLSFSTYLGGNSSETVYGVAVHSGGDIYVAGSTCSRDLPTTTGAYRVSSPGCWCAFVSRLDSAGSTLIYSTYLGQTSGWGLAVDNEGNAYVTGVAVRGFPTTAGAFRTALGGSADAFAAKLNSTGSVLLYSTYLGGSQSDYGYAIGVDSSGIAVVTGYTYSSDYPTTPNAVQRSFGGGTDAFVTKVNQTGTGLVYSTYLGGSGYDYGQGLTLDSSSRAFVTGYASPGFPTTPGAYRAATGFGAFLTKLESDGGSFGYSTYLGPADGWGVAVDSSGNAYVTGRAFGSDYPTTPGALQTAFGGASDAFVTEVNPAGSGLIYSTFLGGSYNEIGNGIVLDRVGNVYVTGETESTNFPTVSPLQSAHSGGSGVFKSGDRGGTWTESNTGLGTNHIAALLIDSRTPSTVYAAGPGTAVFKSTDWGNTWAVSSSGISGDVSALVQDGLNAAVLYAVTSRGVYRSANAGASWARIGFGDTGAYALAVDPKNSAILYAGTPRGVFKSADTGGTWIAMNRGLGEVLDATAIAVDPFNSNNLYAGFWDSSLYRSTNGGSDWVGPGWCWDTIKAFAIDPVNPAIIYAAAWGALCKSTNAGVGWNWSDTGLSYPFLHGMAIDRSTPATLYAGTDGGGLFKSINSGNNWSRVRGGLTAGVVKAVAVDPGDSSKVYAGTYIGTDVFLTKLNLSAGLIWYSTFLGGIASDTGYAVAVDSYGTAYVAGWTESGDFPITSGALRNTMGGWSEGFLLKVREPLLPRPILTTPSPLPAGTVGAAYSQQLQAAGGNPPYRWAVSGSLPPGLALDLYTGLLSGRPTTPGLFSFTVTVTDTLQGAGTRNYTLTINPTGAVVLSITTTSLPGGTVGTAYSATLQASGGTPPYKWSVTPGSLPPGLSLGQSSGALSGTPTTAGTFSFTVQVADSTNTTASMGFSITVTSVSSGPRVSGVVNGASFATGPVSPGEIVTIFGFNFGPPTLTTLRLNEFGQVATVLAETRVLFDWIPAPLIYVSASQIAAIVPYAVGGQASTRVQVEYKGERTEAVTLQVSPSAPGLFTLDASGKGQGAFLNQDYSVNSQSNPAQKNTWVLLYGTGEGMTDPQVADGVLAGAQLLPKPQLPVSVTIGGTPAEVAYAGSAPGMVVGLLQINVKIPPGAPSGNAVPVGVTIGGGSSQAGVTLAIR